MSDDDTDDGPFVFSSEDHRAIADELFKKANESHEKPEEKPEDKQSKKDTSSISLTDDDRKGIAAHLHEMTKAETDAADKEKKANAKDNREQQEHVPSAPRNLFERSLFNIGGK
jgi:hypothetical protein